MQCRPERESEQASGSVPAWNLLNVAPRWADVQTRGRSTHTNTHTLYSHRNTRWGWSGIGHITVSLFSCYVICHQQSLLYPHQMQVAFPNTVPHIFTFSTHTNGLAVYSDVMASPLLWHYWWLNFKLHSRVPSVTYSIALKKKIASTWTSRNITSTDLSWQLWR